MVPGNEEGGERAVAHRREELLLHGAREVLARQADRRVLRVSQVILGVAGDPVEHAHPTEIRRFRFCVIRLPLLPAARPSPAAGHKQRRGGNKVNQTGLRMTALF